MAIDRGVELAQMGVKAMEVTIDSPDWKEILSGLRERLDSDVLLGIGTVMDDTVSEVAVAQSLGASFALSPIDPIGFIDVCKSLGVLAVPSAFTSNECWSMHRRGARTHQALSCRFDLADDPETHVGYQTSGGPFEHLAFQVLYPQRMHLDGLKQVQ